MGFCLLKDEREAALDLLDALIERSPEFEGDDEDQWMVLTLGSIFPERKERLIALLPKEVRSDLQKLPSISISFDKEGLLKLIGQLMQTGWIDLGDSESLAAVATALAIFD